MATVNIPYGGQSVGVEVPDFAMEGTQQDVLEQNSRQTDLLSKIASQMGISVQQENQTVKTNKEIAREISKGNVEQNRSLRDLARGGINLSNKAVNSLVNVTGKEKLSDLVGQQGLLGNAGFAAMGAQVGTVFGIMEEFGSTLGALRRTGAGFGTDLLELREMAAGVGIGFETLSKVVTENGAAIRALGGSTGEGARNFLQLNQGLREATRQAGFFGMSATEMSALLIDEVELRRQTRNETFLEAGARQGLIDSMAENLRLNEISASLTGQDIQDRIKARNEFRRNAVVAAAARNMSEEQLKAQNEMVESLSGLGPSVTPVLQQAMSNMIAGIPMDTANQAFTQLAAAASENGIDLRSNIENLNAMVMGGADPEAIKAEAQGLVDSFKNAQVGGGFLSRAAAGQEGAMMFLQTQQEAFATGAENIAETTDLVNKQLENFGSMVGSAAEQMSGYANQMNVAGEELRVSLVRSITDNLNLDIENPTGFNNFMNAVEKFPTGDGFNNLLDFMISTQYFATGAEGLFRIANIAGPPRSGAEGVQNAASIANLFARIGEAGSVPGAGTTASAITGANTAAEALGLGFDVLGPRKGPDGNPVDVGSYFDNLGENIGEGLQRLKETLTNQVLRVEVTNPSTTN